MPGRTATIVLSSIQTSKWDFPIHLLKASIVCDILALCHLPVDGQVDARQLVGAVLVHDALGLRSEPVDRRIVPPLLQVAVLVELPTLVVEAVGDLVTDHLINNVTRVLTTCNDVQVLTHPMPP